MLTRSLICGRCVCVLTNANFCNNWHVHEFKPFLTTSVLYGRSHLNIRSMMATFTAPSLKISSHNDKSNDSIVIVSDSLDSVSKLDGDIANVLKKYADINKGFDGEVSVVHIDKHPHRLIYSPTGPLNRDYDDVRRVFEAAHKGVQKALKTGSKRPHVTLNVSESHFGKSTPLVGLLGALNPFYVPVLTRELLPAQKQKAEQLGLHFQSSAAPAEELLKLASQLDAARWVMRDIGGTDPERMSAANIAAYVESLFPAGSPVKVRVMSGQSEFEKNYPLYAAVNRGVADVPKHAGRIIFLDYEGDGEIEQSVYLVGKGVVYDTGGHDLKTDGHMAGMHRDKCGAATVGGIFKFLHDTKPRGIRVIGAMCMVRNEIGPHAYVADEIITARSGVRIIITNTDAEGRMAMSDVLCHFKELALERLGKDKLPPHLFTIATLTGHAFIAHGEGYSAIMENGPAKKLHTGRKLQAAGEVLVDMFEISSLRREDYESTRSPNEYGDLLQTVGNGPSTRNPRGHQTPGAFIVLASGLDAHGNDSAKPLPFCHLDIAGGAGDWLHTDPPNPAAMNGLIGTFILPKLKGAALLE